jgi:mono/diheme cytochrome c family protein
MKINPTFFKYTVPALTLSFILFLAACSTRRGEPIKGPLNTNDYAVKTGQAIFMKNCQKCHPGGEAGVGPALNKPMTGFSIRMQVRHGFGPMPAFKKRDISKGEMDYLIAYMKALRKHKKVEK